MNICDVGHRGKAAWRPGLETGALLSNAPSPSPEPLRVRGLEGSQGRFDLTDKTYLEQPPILAGQGSQSQSPGYLPTRVLAELWIAPRDPLYLFVCSMLWHAEADVGAGWELVGGLRSLRQEERIVSAALLARTKSLNLPVDESWWRNGDPDLPHKEPESRRDSRAVNKGMTMKTPYGLEIIENCLSCKLRRKNWFCGLSPDVLKSFSAASHLSTYPGGGNLVCRGAVATGRIRALLRKGEAFHHFARRQSPHTENGRARRGARLKRGNFRDALLRSGVKPKNFSRHTAISTN